MNLQNINLHDKPQHQVEIIEKHLEILKMIWHRLKQQQRQRSRLKQNTPSSKQNGNTK